METHHCASETISSVLPPLCALHDHVRGSAAVLAVVRVASSIGSVFGEVDGLIRVGRPFSAAYRTVWLFSNQFQVLGRCAEASS